MGVGKWHNRMGLSTRTERWGWQTPHQPWSLTFDIEDVGDPDVAAKGRLFRGGKMFCDELNSHLGHDLGYIYGGAHVRAVGNPSKVKLTVVPSYEE